MPEVYLKRLETLWFQVTGSYCNLQCAHCFISCGPGNNSHEMLSVDAIKGYLKEAQVLGVREFYFTGGEPFLHPEIVPILKEALNYGMTTVLSNGTLITNEISQTLSKISMESKYNLEFRISLESDKEGENDRIRGQGSFRKAVRGIQHLIRSGFNPILTVTNWSGNGDISREVEEHFESFARSINIPQLRLKRLPLVLLGRCAELTRPYSATERVTDQCFKDFSMDNLQCSTSRIVTSKGVYVCPILVSDTKAWMGRTLKESFGPYNMESPACYTCRISGLTCKNDNENNGQKGGKHVLRDDSTILSNKKLKISIHNTVRKSVKEFYANAAIQSQKELCCPTSYKPEDIEHIPQKVLDVSYGCGSPVSLARIKPGETVLDLGSGGGVDCFIAAKLVGERGLVVGIDMTDEMLYHANASKEAVARNLGFDNIRFLKGFLEEIPLVDESVDLITSNCVVNLSTHKEKVFQEIFRVLKTGGRFVISDIVSEKEVPSSMKQDKKLWSQCISGAVTEPAFFQIAKETGFYGLEIINRYVYKVVEGLTFYSLTVMAHKYKKSNECLYNGQYAIYKGPFGSVTDDDGHTFPAGIPVEVCTDTAWKLSNPPYKGLFILSDMPDSYTKTLCGPQCC